jgi:hypothetical protein
MVSFRVTVILLSIGKLRALTPERQLVLRDALHFTDPISVNRLVHTYTSYLHVPYNNPQSDDYSTDFRVINGEVLYTANINNSKYIVLLDTGSNVSVNFHFLKNNRYKSN